MSSERMQTPVVRGNEYEVSGIAWRNLLEAARQENVYGVAMGLRQLLAVYAARFDATELTALKPPPMMVKARPTEREELEAKRQHMEECILRVEQIVKRLAEQGIYAKVRPPIYDLPNPLDTDEETEEDEEEEEAPHQ